MLTVAIAEYEDARRNVPPVEAAGKRLSSLYEGVGHVAFNAAIHPRAVESQVRTLLAGWGTAEAEVGLLLWSSHCERDEPEPRIHLSDRDARAGTVADWMTQHRFRHWIVIVDACFGGSVINAWFVWLQKATRAPDHSCVLISSADSITPADAGRFTDALTDVLIAGPGNGWWTTVDDFLEVDELQKRLDEELVRRDPQGRRSVPLIGGSGRAGRVFPNPLYRPRSAAVALDEVHFVPKARGIDLGESGWFFTGRAELLRRLVGWLTEPGNGFYVVTGPAGTGKSAVVGRLVTLSVPEFRGPAEAAGLVDDAPAGTVPPAGLFTAVFHARDRRVDQLLDHLGRALGVEQVRAVSDLITGARLSDRQVVVAVDALDEAAPGHGARMVDEVLARLARLPGVKVLVGTRPGVVRWQEEVDAPVAGVADLAQEPHTPADIAAYARARLLGLQGSSYAGHPDLARAVAEAVAARALGDPTADGRRVGSFLVARLVTGTLAAQPRMALSAGWEEGIPSGYSEALAADLDSYRHRHGDKVTRRIEAILEGLAWDEGSGVPRRLIGTMARAVTGHAIEDDDVPMLLREAAGHLLEAEAQGWAVYRLYHERLREHLREQTRRREEGKHG